MNEVELAHGVFRLIGLQVPNQMPFYLALKRLRFVQRLLDAVLSDVHDARINGLLHRRDGMVFRHGNQLHRRVLRDVRPPRPRGHDLGTHLLNLLPDHRSFTHFNSITAARRPVLPPAAR